jgi:pimeloyl-ACP methyl ester carboxylesterase
MGLSFTHEMWGRVLPTLQQHYRCIYFDNRGMGRSSVPPGPYSIRLMASDAAAVLSAAGVHAAHIIGASMGGMIAQELALRHPERVLSLVLGCTSYSGLFARWPHYRFVPRRVQWSRYERLERERSLRSLLYSDTTPEERIEEDVRIRCSCNWSYRGFFNQFLGVLRWSSYRRLPSIQKPTLVMHGDQDHLVPVENGQVVASRIPGARFALIRDAGHVLTTDQTDACLAALESFLTEVAGNRVDALRA